MKKASRGNLSRQPLEDARSIDSSIFEPEMQIFTMEDEATSEVKKPSSSTIAHTAPRKISTTIPSITSPIKVVPNLFLNHLRYDFNFLNKARRTIDNAYAAYNSLLVPLYTIFYRYAYAIGYSIDDLVGVNPITCASCSLCVCTFRILPLHHSLRSFMLRVDVPWDPGGFRVWC